jgi:hypothetical protein
MNITEVLSIILRVLAIIGWVLILFDWWKLKKTVERLTEQTKGMYNGITLIMFALGLLKPEKKGKKIDPKTGIISLTFNVELLQKIDIRNAEKEKQEKEIKKMVKSFKKMVKDKKKGGRAK